MSEIFRTQSSPIAGKGIFATQPIQPGQHICYMDGDSCTAEEVIARITAGDEVISDPLQVGKEELIDLHELFRTFNHSCNANAYLRGRNEMVALRAIAPDEEITYDYSMTMNYDHAKFVEVGLEPWTCPCACGAANCRGIIDEFKTLPLERRKYYLEHRMLQDYVLEMHGG